MGVGMHLTTTVTPIPSSTQISNQRRFNRRRRSYEIRVARALAILNEAIAPEEGRKARVRLTPEDRAALFTRRELQDHQAAVDILRRLQNGFDAREQARNQQRPTNTIQ